MKKEHKEILEILSKYLEENPSQRFGQALFNLTVNDFTNRNNPELDNYKIRNIHSDQDFEILDRMKNQLKWFDKQSS